MPWYREYFPPSSPRAAKGGIRSRSKRGAFATNWWGKRWLDVLEALNLGARLQRGRSYARKGQVLDITVEPGAVGASVQGSRAKPYRITIGTQKLAKKELEALAATLATEPWVLAKLMTREMPQDIERLFDTAGVALFPKRASELKTECSCPDWSNPCKHIAAVYYLLGEEFDRDPFLIFRLRGVEVDALLASAGMAQTGAAESELNEPGDDDNLRPAVVIQGTPPPESFWEGTRPEVDLTGVAPAPQPAPLLRLLGNLPFWRGAQPLLRALEPHYAAAIDPAMSLIAGEDRDRSA